MRLRIIALCLFFATSLNAGLQVKDVEYKEGKAKLRGFVAWDDSYQGKRPGVLIVHQWMGLTDYEKGRAKQLAQLGYVAFTADIYGQLAKDQAEAGELAGRYKNDRALYLKRVEAGLGALKKQANVDSSKLAAMGYCFGGMGVLELARANAPVRGVVSFHGSLAAGSSPAKPGIKSKILALHGADDPFVSAKEVAGFEDELRAARADWQLVKYSGAVHAFTQPMAGNDPSKGAAYNHAADKRSWRAMQAFFEELFQ